MWNYLRRRREADRASLDATIRAAIHAEASRLETDNAGLRDQIKTLNAQLSEIGRERNELKTRVRAQTEADLAVVSLRILQKLITGDDAGAKLLAQQQASLQQQLGMLNVYPYAGGFGGAASALGGLASAFTKAGQQ